MKEEDTYTILSLDWFPLPLVKGTLIGVTKIQPGNWPV